MGFGFLRGSGAVAPGPLHGLSQRLEEGLPGLPGMPMMPGMPGAAGTATAAVGAVGLGQGSVNGQGLGSDPWAGVAVDSSSSRETLRNKRGRGTLEQ